MQNISDTISKIRTVEYEVEDDIKEEAVRFFKQQSMVKVSNEILKMVADGNITNTDEKFEELAKSLQIGDEKYKADSLLEGWEEALTPEARIVIPTGVSKIDETLEGGLGKGELALFLSPQGCGKTTWSVATCSYAATYRCEANNYQGFKVLQLYFEDKVNQVRSKHIARIVGIESKDIRKPVFVDIVKERFLAYEDLEMLQKNLHYVKLKSGETTIQDIYKIIKKEINSGFRPDMISIDYFECINLDNFGGGPKDVYTAEGKAMRKLESMGDDFNAAMWVTTQGTKDAVNLEMLTLDKMGGSVKKSQIGHIILTLARTIEDKERKTATIFIAKNRSGADGKVLSGISYDNGLSRISSDETEDFESIISYNKKRVEDELEAQKRIFQQTKKK
jgi:replicative DNA helicase